MKLNQILFVCVENSGRSQMAEAFFKKYNHSNFESTSAGTKPGDEINPDVKKVMEEIGITIQNQKPKILTDEMIDSSKKIVNMGCMDSQSCPSLFVNGILDWKIQDPKEKSLDEVRIIRDQIENKVKELISTLE